ncbi:DEDD exonuclease domain-containing protein [Cellulomonas shaoxiangyii]|uniref:DEDD exonuclease domain-containing protein n=1 Tax=Cellulomonas shaoxiangyii TaxID=2566013 RepID=A0A4P7SJV7_9CELL|nr:DEDD exonuclease domain-containing protein [Cellulomonas shaoxiangyii]QCB93406.1 DEDD exonuclease domain-containing protein [Cellulomonas shaoxiangyii]TGY79836.1 DEDD exonuclease domain-containing protein [Cellulomonas shaoxiangyii]
MPSVRRLRPVWAETPGTVPPPPGAPAPAAVAVQPGLDELGTPLADVTFVVVDLETTGGRAGTDAITEIGAVKVRGGEVLGEFQTLVDPGGPVPPFIQVLTGITTSMLVGAPRIEEVLPSFLEFARGAVLVAHNAPFDVGFLRAAAARCERAWPGFQVVDTVRLARRVVLRDEAPNHKLSTLAALFRAEVAPNHRALSDARATVDVLHALLGRLAPLGVTHLEDLADAADPVPSDVRRRSTLADGLPDAPGVYLFRGPREEVLYVGTSTTSLRKRVRSYFTSAEKRGRMTEMVRLAVRVDPVVCATPLEARVRELRLIAEHAPRYNRRSRAPERMPWVRLTDEAYPRLSVVRDVRSGTAHIGPFASQASAQLAVEALHETFAVRRCTRRLPLLPAAGAHACVLAELGRCGAPCTGGQDHADYGTVADQVRAAMAGDPGEVVAAHAARIRTLVAQERFEEAATVRDRLLAFARGAARTQRHAPLARCAELVAARRTDDGGWELVLVRHGRLAGTVRVDRRTDPRPVVATLRATGEHVAAPTAPATAAHPEETDLVLAWLEQPGVRLVEISGEWASPVRSAQSVRDAVAAVAVDLLLPRPPLLDDVPPARPGAGAPSAPAGPDVPAQGARRTA